MKKYILITIFLLSAIWSNATNYYFSNTTGDDSRTSTQAQNPATPWKTLSKLNSFWSSLNAGDSVFFQRGNTYYGTVTSTNPFGPLKTTCAVNNSKLLPRQVNSNGTFV